MGKEKRVLAIDLGASSGRAILGIFDGKNITLEEVHRFANEPVSINGTLFWDTLRLLHDIKQGILKAKIKGGFDSIGIDTWGVDFGLIDDEGYLVENPVHYRDIRTKGLVEESFGLIPKEEFYGTTGIQFMELNTAFQLYSLKKQRPHLLERADKMLLTPDLFNYMLTGIKSTEYSIASTTQLLDANKRDWAWDIIDRLGLPRKLFTKIVPPGTVIGQLSDEICNELGVPKADVVSIASHDTQSAAVAVPAKHKDFIFISCGTWSLFGTELDKPIINEKSEQLNITNEGGYGNTITFIKNIIGLWLIQESRRQWQREGNDYSYAQLEKYALAAEPFVSFIDPDAPEFVPQGNLPKRVREYCKKTEQPVPETVGEIMRCIYQSLALKYRYAYEQIRECTGKQYEDIHMVGGGTKDNLLCQMTANSCNCNVIAGPIEATVIGNIAVQLIASGHIDSTEQARKIIARSQNVVTYTPDDTDVWNQAYAKFKAIIEQE